MRWLVWVAALALPPLAVILSSDADVAVRLAAALLVSVPIGLWIAIRAPVVMYRIFAFVLGAIPFGTLPGFPLPLVLLLGVGIGVTAIVQLPQQRKDARFTALEWAAVVLIVVSAASMLVNLTSGYDVSEFAKWLIATSALLSLMRLDLPAMRSVGRAFVAGSAVAAVFALVLLIFDPSGSRLSLLSFLGYGTSGEDNLRYVFDASGATVRLTGTYVDPNVGGLFLFVALLLAMSYFRGVLRIGLTVLLGVCMALTLSRAAIFSTVVAILVLFAVQNLTFGKKMRVFTVLALGAGALLLIPTVQNRLLASFGQFDRGTTDRVDALRDFPKLMDGHWLFGLGWGRLEFRDGAAGIAVNYVANSPLLTVYRGGVLVGLAFVALLVVALIASWRGLRSGDLGLGIVGAGFVGFAAVALQVDFPVVTIPPVTALFSLLLAALPRIRDLPEPLTRVHRFGEIASQHLAGADGGRRG